MGRLLRIVAFFIWIHVCFGQECFEKGVDYPRNDIQEGKYVSTSTAKKCQRLCQKDNHCNFWTWDPTWKNACWMKTTKTQSIPSVAVTSGPKNCPEECYETGVDYPGHDIEEGEYVSATSAESCQETCQKNSKCNFWTWDPTYNNACWMKTAKTETSPSPALISGPKHCEDEEKSTTSPGELTTATPSGDGSHSVKVMSYNLYGWNALGQNPWKAENVFKAIRAIEPDILGAQECEGREQQVAASIGADYAVAGVTAGHAIIYRTSVLTLEDHGEMELKERDQFGPRTIEFAHLTHKPSGRKVDFFNTHLCLCNGEQLLGSARTMSDFMVRKRRSGSRIFLTGDFNNDYGYEESKIIRYFKGQLDNSPLKLDDTFRSYHGAEADGKTFPGKPGKIDYVMVDQGAVVEGAEIHRNWADQGKASDHWPVSALVNLAN